jgi:Arc/MetJ family transcription regulator
MNIHIEMTDLQYDGMGWCGNYCWVNRAEIEIDDDASDAKVNRAIRAAIGIDGDASFTRDAWSGADWSWRSGCIGVSAAMASN